MGTPKCQLCNTYLYPGDRRYRLNICICPDQDDDCPGTGLCGADIQDDSSLPAGLEEELWQEDGEEEREFCQEASLILCQECQDQFLQNPVVRENLLFPVRESQTKTVH